MVYKTGKLPARPGATKLKFADYLAVDKPPAQYTHTNLVEIWGMLGNDTVGDCVLAGAGHETILWNAEGHKSVNVTTQNALSDYSAITGYNPKKPSSDKGTDMQVAAKYRQKTGVIDDLGKRHKIGAYLAIDYTTPTELKQAIYMFGAVGLGIQFPNSAMDQFNAGQDWTVVKGAKIDGGHYVPLVGYDSKFVYLVTWGKLIRATWVFVTTYADEALVYLSPEMLINNVSLEGFNLTQLQADLKQLQGAKMNIFKVSAPTKSQLAHDAERAVGVFLVGAVGVWLGSPDKFSKATGVAAILAGITAVYGLLKSTTTTL